MNEWRTEFWGGQWTIIKGTDEKTRLAGFDSKTEAEGHIRSMDLYPPVERETLAKALTVCGTCLGSCYLFDTLTGEWTDEPCVDCNGTGIQVN